MFKKIMIIAVMIFCMVSVANAIHITEIDGGNVIDFSQFVGTNPIWDHTKGPIQVGDLTGDDVQWLSSPATSIIGNGVYKFNSNGQGTENFNGIWNSDMNGFVALNNENGYMEFVFAEPVSHVGGFINYGIKNVDVLSSRLEILTIDDIVLETWILGIDTPMDSVNDGEFCGFTRDQADIYKFRLYDNFIALDSLTYINSSSGPYGNPPAPVPEPSTFILFGIGMLGIGIILKKKAR